MRALSLLLLSITLALTGCSDSSTGPQVPPPPVALATETVGPGGGTLAADGFSLEIPAGAFTTDTALKLYRYTGDFPAEGGPATGTYRISGLPAGFAQPLTLTLDVTAKVEEEGEPLVLLGEEVFIKSLQASGPAWNPLEAELADGKLVAELPPLPSSGKESATDFEFLDLPLGGTFYYSSLNSAQGHFKVYHPLGMAAAAGDLGGYLEEAYSVFQGMGFSYGARTRWPVRAIVLALGPDRSGECVPSIWGNNYGSLRFSTQQLPQSDVMRVTAGHEFFHLIQAYYDPRGAYTRATEASAHLWLDEATAVWSEELFSSTLNYVSSLRSGQVMEPFEGIQAGMGGNAGWHGYGMSALVKYLVDRHSDTVIRSLYDRIQAGDHPVAAVKAVEGDFDSWLTTFFQDYFSGSLYGDNETPFMIAGHLGEFKISTAADTLKTFTKQDPALSACLFKVVLSYPQMNDATYAEIELEGDGPAMVSVFKYNSTDGAVLLGSSDEMVAVDGLKELMEEDNWIIVMVTAMHEDAPHYFATQAHTTKIHVKQGVAILEALARTSRIFFEAAILGGQHDFSYSDPDTTYPIENQNNFPNMGGTYIPGDIFDGPWPSLGLGGRSFQTYMSYNIWEWNLSGTFSADGRMLQSLSAYGEARAEGNDVTIFSFNLYGVPLTYENIQDESCNLTWTSMGTGSMSDISYVRTFDVMLEDDTMGTGTISYVGSDWYSPVARFTFQQRSP